MAPDELGRRLRAAREARGLSQRKIAKALDLPRAAVTQLEEGSRPVSTLELSRLSALYFRSVSTLLLDSEQHEDVLMMLCRAAPSMEKDLSAGEQAVHCIGLCREGMMLERLLEPELPPELPDYGTRAPHSPEEAAAQGERVAEQERNRLDMGCEPIVDISELIGKQGIWASGAELPDKIPGLFLRCPGIGSAVLVNSSHPRGHRRFSYAHEYAHALFDREWNIMLSSIDSASRVSEQRANSFATAFLMPREGIYNVLRSLDKSSSGRREQTAGASGAGIAAKTAKTAKTGLPPRSQAIGYKTVAMLAHHFGVVYQTALYRLRDLQCVSRQQYQALLKQESPGRKYLKALSLHGDVDATEQHQCRYRELRSEAAHMAVEAYLHKEISRGRVLELSRTLRIKGDTLLYLAEAGDGS